MNIRTEQLTQIEMSARNGKWDFVTDLVLSNSQEIDLLTITYKSSFRHICKLLKVDKLH